MAEQTETSLIGYDPLVWLNQSAPEPTSKDPQILAADVHSVVETQTSIKEEERVVASTISQLLEPQEIYQPPPDSWGDQILPSDSAKATPADLAFVLDTVLNIRNVAELHAQFCALLDQFNSIEIDASAVTVVDTASLQLLLILKQTAIRMQKQVSIDFPSEKFIEACNLLGISAMLEVDHAASGLF